LAIGALGHWPIEGMTIGDWIDDWIGDWIDRGCQSPIVIRQIPQSPVPQSPVEWAMLQSPDHQ
jgi:hypothetical protein